MPEAIATIADAGASSHGVRSIVRLIDGRCFEARETVEELLRVVAQAWRM